MLKPLSDCSVAVVGLGLMGASLCMDLKAQNLCREVRGVARRTQTVAYVVQESDLPGPLNNVATVAGTPIYMAGMPGGAALVAINTTEHPEEVAKVMEYLTNEAVMSEFYARTLFIPGHLGLAESGVDFATELPQAKQALEMFSSQVGKLQPLAYDLQAYKYNTILFNSNRDRLAQVLAGELTLDEAIQKMQEDIDAGIGATQ